MTKKAFRDKCREILYGESEVTGEDFIFILDILKRHTEADSKIGVGVKRMWSQQNPVYTNTRCFFIERIDGTTTDFSFTHCLSPRNDFNKACREAVYPQIKKFRQDNNMDNTRHADHHPESFDSIVNRFTAIHGKSKIKPTEDNSFGCHFIDKKYEQKWSDFHQQEATLRNVSATENLTKKRL